MNSMLMRLFGILGGVLAPATARAGYDDIWATWMPPAVTPVKERIHEFHNILLVIIIAISVFVTALLLYTVFRFARAKNPNPSKTTHNVTIEIIWTAIPCVILAVIMWYSFPLMYYMDKAKSPDLTLKVTGYQWYWGYAYPDQGIDEFTLHMVPDAGKRDPKNEAVALRSMPTYQRLLSTYDQVSGKPAFVVLPVNKDVRVLVTAGDVLHSFAMPAFGVKKDAVPGRLNETWMRIEKPGIYYGQCSELCGTDHAFMPIEIRAVDDAAFATWTDKMKTDKDAAMDYIQNITAQYARPQVTAPKLTLRDLWDEAKKRLQ